MRSQAGVAVFVTDAEAAPRELVIERDLTLEGTQSPRKLSLRADLPLGRS